VSADQVAQQPAWALLSEPRHLAGSIRDRVPEPPNRRRGRGRAQTAARPHAPNRPATRQRPDPGNNGRRDPRQSGNRYHARTELPRLGRPSSPTPAHRAPKPTPAGDRATPTRATQRCPPSRELFRRALLSENYSSPNQLDARFRPSIPGAYGPRTSRSASTPRPGYRTRPIQVRTTPPRACRARTRRCRTVPWRTILARTTWVRAIRRRTIRARTTRARLFRRPTTPLEHPTRTLGRGLPVRTIRVRTTPVPDTPGAKLPWRELPRREQGGPPSGPGCRVVASPTN